MTADPLARYKAKRNFSATPEPAGDRSSAKNSPSAARFVVHKHWASHLHYDLRLEIDGTMKSWAVPKGPSLDPAHKRMAVAVEDHPISYNTFEGRIPAGQYGAGRVIVWDKGIWVPDTDPQAQWRKGRLKFALQGHKLRGRWTLIRTGHTGSVERAHWLLIKERDDAVRRADDYDVLAALPDSVADWPAVAVHRSSADRATHVDGAALAAAPDVALPPTLVPALAMLAAHPPEPHADWLYELKFDGYRMLARIDGQQVRLLTRNGNDWSARMPDLSDALRRLALEPCWLDGEVVLPDANGVPDFNGLQNAFDSVRARGLLYYLFDLPYYAGKDLRMLPLSQRRAALRAALGSAADGMVRYSDTFDVPPQDLIASACKIGFEGVIGKLRTSDYSSGRTANWIKLKCGLRQEFVIGGFTQPRGSRVGLGALLLGVHDTLGRLHYAGKVGSGFDGQTLRRLRDRLSTLKCRDSPFAEPFAVPNGSVQWVAPTMLAEVAFAAWTPANHIRHAVFKGSRDDKAARTIIREQPVQNLPTAAALAMSPSADGVPISHGERVIDPNSGTTKMDLARYYAKVAPLLLEHLCARPVSLVRAPEGVGGQSFFQKHQQDTAMSSHLRALPAELDPGHAPLIEVSTARALMEAAQHNVIEFHTWNARKDRIDRPDRMCFDLDPGDRVAWVDVLAGADLVHVLLQELGLPSFLKTSGGKGLHIVVPIKRLYPWHVVKGFSAAIVRHLAKVIPQRFVAKSGPRNRVGKIFVDYLRNGRGATTVSAWSARVRAGMGISVPIGWDELGDMTSGAHWNMANIEQRLRIGNHPWQNYASSATSLTGAMRMIGFESASRTAP